MAVIDVPDSLKMIRETLCVAQTRIAHSEVDKDRKHLHIDLLGRMIAEIDRQRPLGPDGKHGNLHTPDCGCEGVRRGVKAHACQHCGRGLGETHRPWCRRPNS